MRRALVLVVMVVSALGLTACGGTERSTTPKVIEVTFSGDDVSPNGQRFEVSVDQPIVLEVTADKPGTIHVHSDPQSEFEYGAGKTTIKFAISEQGVVEVESHHLNKQILSLEVK